MNNNNSNSKSKGNSNSNSKNNRLYGRPFPYNTQPLPNHPDWEIYGHGPQVSNYVNLTNSNIPLAQEAPATPNATNSNKNAPGAPKRPLIHQNYHIPPGISASYNEEMAVASEEMNAEKNYNLTKKSNNGYEGNDETMEGGKRGKRKNSKRKTRKTQRKRKTHRRRAH
jgi:hypothetical protein